MDLSLLKALAVLGLNTAATLKDIKKSYRVLAKTHHPDHKGPGADARMAEINAAYALLRDHYPGPEPIANQVPEDVNPQESGKSAYELMKEGRAAFIAATRRYSYSGRWTARGTPISRPDSPLPAEKSAQLDKASRAFTELLREYPQSGFAAEAREKLARILEWK